MTDSDGSNAGLQSERLPQKRGPSRGTDSASGNHPRTKWPAWAVYLGVSWTWCIGMFLPALLWRDFGIWSFVVFALPNIIGAALLGVVMRSPEASRAYIERHRFACVAFSVVTIAFQVFFAAWVARVMGAMTAGGGWVWHIGWVACVLGTVVGGGRKWGARVGVLVWVVSLAAIIVTIVRATDAGALDELLTYKPPRPQAELVPLAMVCTLGFMLCPYLDLTFHRARIESGRESGRAFGVGFGVVFALMIVGTLLTAPVLLWLVGARVAGLDLRTFIVPLLALHTLPQLVYTCWVHGSEVRGGERLAVVTAALVAGLGIALVDGGVLMSRYDILYAAEVIYRVFLGFYGLVAPAYVAIVSWPVSLGGAPIQRSRLVIFAVVVLAALWFDWLGFVERHTWWVAIGVVIVVAGKVVSRFFDPTLANKPKT